MDPAALDHAAGSWVSAKLAARRPPRRRVVLAIDGKALRGAWTSQGAAPHLLACLDHSSGVVCAQVAVAGAGPWARARYLLPGGAVPPQDQRLGAGGEPWTGQFQAMPFQCEITLLKGVVASVWPTAHALRAEVAATP